MIRTMMHAKLHGARVTDHNLDYIGSVTIDQDLMDAVGILPHEEVWILNKNNGARFGTYTLVGQRGSGDICVNGAAARHVSMGDELLIVAYGQFNDEEARNHSPKVAFLSADNQIIELST